MLDEFKKNYEAAQYTCNKKFQKIRMERTMKDDYFYDESSYASSEGGGLKLVSKKAHKTDFYESSKHSQFPTVPKLTNISSLTNVFRSQPFIRSDSSQSFYKTSERHKKLLELDSDIRELDNLGLLEHEKQSSFRSKSSFRSGELSPIRRDKVKVRGGKRKSGETRADYQENVIKNKKNEDSGRRRKVIRDKSDFKDRKKEEIFNEEEVISHIEDINISRECAEKEKNHEKKKIIEKEKIIEKINIKAKEKEIEKEKTIVKEKEQRKEIEKGKGKGKEEGKEKEKEKSI